MKPSDSLKGALEDLTRALERRDEGTADYPRKQHRVDTAYQRALDHMGVGNLPNYDQRGGSTTLQADADDQKNAQRVMRQAVLDLRRFDELVTTITSTCRELARLTDRHAETVGPNKQDETTGLPGCRSCARKEQQGDETIGGKFSGVSDKGTAPTEGLCRQCYEFKLATGGLPPVQWCHRLQTKGAKDANRWLAREFPHLKESVDRKAKHRITTDDLELRADDVIVA